MTMMTTQERRGLLEALAAMSVGCEQSDAVGEQIVLPNMDAWEEFAAANREALEEAYGSTANALQHAIQGGLTMGGGAAPLFFISFEEGI
jgi:hypothetical protein